MDRAAFYNGGRVDMAHLYRMQEVAEEAVTLLAKMVFRRASEGQPLPGGVVGFGASFLSEDNLLAIAPGVAISPEGIAVSTPADYLLSVEQYISQPFNVYALLGRAPTHPVDMVIRASASEPPAVQSKNSRLSDILTFQAGTTAPSEDWFQVLQCIGWEEGEPVCHLVGPLTALGVGGLDSTTPTTITDALQQLADRFLLEHVGNGPNNGKHGNVNAASLKLRSSIGSGHVEAFSLGNALITLGTSLSMAKSETPLTPFFTANETGVLAKGPYATQSWVTYAKNIPMMAMGAERHSTTATEAWRLDARDTIPRWIGQWDASWSPDQVPILLIPLDVPVGSRIKSLSMTLKTPEIPMGETLTLQVTIHRLDGTIGTEQVGTLTITRTEGTVEQWETETLTLGTPHLVNQDQPIWAELVYSAGEGLLNGVQAYTARMEWETQAPVGLPLP